MEPKNESKSVWKSLSQYKFGTSPETPKRSKSNSQLYKLYSTSPMRNSTQKKKTKEKRANLRVHGFTLNNHVRRFSIMQRQNNRALSITSNNRRYSLVSGKRGLTIVPEDGCQKKKNNGNSFKGICKAFVKFYSTFYYIWKKIISFVCSIFFIGAILLSFTILVFSMSMFFMNMRYADQSLKLVTTSRLNEFNEISSQFTQYTEHMSASTNGLFTFKETLFENLYNGILINESNHVVVEKISDFVHSIFPDSLFSHNAVRIVFVHDVYHVAIIKYENDVISIGGFNNDTNMLHFSYYTYMEHHDQSDAHEEFLKLNKTHKVPVIKLFEPEFQVFRRQTYGTYTSLQFSNTHYFSYVKCIEHNFDVNKYTEGTLYISTDIPFSIFQNIILSFSDQFEYPSDTFVVGGCEDNIMLLGTTFERLEKAVPLYMYNESIYFNIMMDTIEKHLKKNHTIHSNNAFFEAVEINGFDVFLKHYHYDNNVHLFFFNVAKISHIRSEYTWYVIFSSIGISCFTVFISLCFIILLSSSMCQYSLVSREFKKVEKMKLENINLNFFTFLEFQLLKHMIRSMVIKLAQFRSFLPQHVYSPPKYKHRKISIPSSPNSNLNLKEEEEANEKSINNEELSESDSEGYDSDDTYANDNKGLVSKTWTFESMECEEEELSDVDEMLQIGLKKREVVCVMIDYVLLQSSMNSEVNFKELDKRMFFEGLFLCCKRYKGKICEFSHSKVIVSFFYDKKKTNEAYMTPINFAKSLFSKNLNLFCNSFQIFIASGDLWEGNIGCSFLKKFITKGKALDYLKVMKEEVPLIVPIVINDKYQSIMTKFVESRKISKTAYELGRRIVIKKDEWMYELDQMKKYNRWNDFKSAYERVENGQVNLGLKMMKEFLKVNKNDKVAAYFIEKWSKSNTNEEEEQKKDNDDIINVNIDSDEEIEIENNESKDDNVTEVPI